MVVFFLIGADLFGVFYYLRMKSLGTAILIVLVAITAVIMYLMNQQPPKDELEPFGKEDKPDNTSQPQSIGDMLGIGTSEEYNRRLEKSVGM